MEELGITQKQDKVPKEKANNKNEKYNKFNLTAWGGGLNDSFNFKQALKTGNQLTKAKS